MPEKFSREIIYGELNMLTRLQIAQSDSIWIYGDNLRRTGYGGQAAICRGLSNTIGIAVKLAPNNHFSSFVQDKDFAEWAKIIDCDINKVYNEIQKGKQVYIIRGIGEGRAQLPEKAPKVFAYLTERLNYLISIGAKWKS